MRTVEQISIYLCIRENKEEIPQLLWTGAASNGGKTLRISIQTCVLQTQALTTLVDTTCLVSCAT